MRKAGKFDDVTVNEITYRVGDAVRKAGALLEDLAPRDGRPTKKSVPGRRLYSDVLDDAKMAERTARDWRAASKLNADAYSKYLTKLHKQGDRLKLRDLYRLGRPAQEGGCERQPRCYWWRRRRALEELRDRIDKGFKDAERNRI